MLTSNDNKNNFCFKGQFILTKEIEFIIPEWENRRKGNWILSSHPSLPVINIFAKNEQHQHIGWMLGYPINTNLCSLCEDKIVVNVTNDNLVSEELIESELRNFGGRFLVIIISDNFSRVYPDASGSLSIFYSSEKYIIVSTTKLIENFLEKHDKSFVSILNSAKLQSRTWYPCGFSNFKNLKLLLPNHFLNLETWQYQRYWPRNEIEPIKFWEDPKDVVKEIIKLITSNINAVASHHILHLNLTAGRDTRMLLACSQKSLDKSLFSTSYQDKNQTDVLISLALSKLFNLNHICNQYQYIDRERVILTGFGGEIGRSFYWQNQDKATDKLYTKDLVIRLNYPTGNYFIDNELKQWLSEVNHFSKFLILDLLYIEHRLGCCMGQVMYSYDEISKFSLYPMNHRKIFELMLKLPYEYRKKQKLAHDICKINWCELLDIPFNSPHFTGIVRYKHWLKQICKSTLAKITGTYTEKHKILVEMSARDKKWLWKDF